jgi:hypothetical protein
MLFVGHFCGMSDATTAESRSQKYLQLISFCCRINRNWIFKATTVVS